MLTLKNLKNTILNGIKIPIWTSLTDLKWPLLLVSYGLSNVKWILATSIPLEIIIINTEIIIINISSEIWQQTLAS